MTPEQKFLLEKAKRSLSAAKQLLQQDFYEFSVSRAYYSMFYVAEARLDKEGLSFSSHAAVISAFGRVLSKPQKVPQEFHRYLIDAQAQRTSADYAASSLFGRRSKNYSASAIFYRPRNAVFVRKLIVLLHPTHFLTQARTALRMALLPAKRFASISFGKSCIGSCGKARLFSASTYLSS